jgi:hypothetical protein
MDLIFSYRDSDNERVGKIPFQYESKEKFIADVREFVKDHKWKYTTVDHHPYRTVPVEILDDVYLNEGDVRDLEKYVSTIEEWFNANKYQKEDFKFKQV